MNDTISITRIDFSSQLFKKCSKNVDYETYWPFKDEECIFDKKFSYNRRKVDSACINMEEDYKPSLIECQHDEKIIIYSTETSIIEYDADTQIKRPLVNLKNSTNSFDYDYNMKCLFWYDYLTKEIKKNCKNSKEEILLRGIQSVSDMRIDWINKKIYWIEIDNIAYSDYNGEAKRFLKSINKTDLLAIDSLNSIIYWNKFDEGKNTWFIMKSKINEKGLMDEEILVETITKINSLIFFNNILYFIIDKNISSVKLDSKSIETIYRATNNITGFAISEQRIYYKENDPLSDIQYRLKYDLSNLVTISHTRDNITKIIVYESNLEIPDKYNCLHPTNYNCLLMCLNSPELYSCSNTSGFYIEKKSNERVKIPELSCSPGQFKCLNDRCISSNSSCDNIDDCFDSTISISDKSSDETLCNIDSTDLESDATISHITNNSSFTDNNNNISTFSFKNIILTSSFAGIVALFTIFTIIYYTITRKRRFKFSPNYQNLNDLSSNCNQNYANLVTNSASNLLQELANEQEPIV